MWLSVSISLTNTTTCHKIDNSTNNYTFFNNKRLMGFKVLHCRKYGVKLSTNAGVYQ